ncbi:MAG TPA: hypothetical protein VE781_15245 [Kineosporiaceae bacterium]|nr:hypothetical protein [Kineosporiaceae bacterium]
MSSSTRTTTPTSTLTTRGATARTDVPAPAPTAGIGAALTPRAVRRLGTGLAIGALAWAAPLAVWGPNPDPADTAGVVAITAGAFLFQLGVYLLLAVQARTGAIGTGRAARVFIAVEHVLVAGAILNTLDPALPFLRGTLWHGVFDACWPLSMLGMFAIGVRIAVKGRWRGVLRLWPLVAESWAVVVVPVSGFAPSGTGVVGALHLLVGYVTLGVLLARRPALVLGTGRE